MRGRVEFRGVGHRFPDADRDTLHDVSFTVEPGQTVALVGRSGSGKTTLVNMLPRFVLAETGTILVDDVPVNDLTLRSLRSHLSLVSQDVVLFDDTIAANVGYGALGEASEQQVRDALAAANLLEFVEGLPNGLQTQVGENAARLSGGQRQRLAIARALIKNAPILILDEATSALDNESERQVQASLERLMRGRTTLVIAHRLSTVQNADRIIVLDAGRIVEQGAHSELLAANGLYASLYKMQFREDSLPKRLRAAPRGACLRTGKAGSAASRWVAIDALDARLRAARTRRSLMSVPAEGNQLVNVVVLLGAAVVAVPLFKRLGLGRCWVSGGRPGDRPVRHRLLFRSQVHPARRRAGRGDVPVHHRAGDAALAAVEAARRDLRPGCGPGACGALLTGVGLLAGLSAPAAFMAAMGFVLSSTAIVMQILAERDETASAQGQRIVSILLLEDLAIVPLLALAALLAPAGTGGHGDPWTQAAIALGCVLALLAAGRWLLNPLFRLLAARAR